MRRSPLLPSVCLLCGSAEARPFSKGEGFTYVRCADCGLVYQNPRYTFQHLRSRVYVRKYFDYELRNEENFFNLMLLNLRDARFERAASGFRSPRRRFLDIGCATGRLISHMKGQGWSVTGVELCAESCAYARTRYKVRVVNSTLEEARFKPASFEAVHMSHVIEHVPDPRSTLSEIGRILVPGGLFLCVTPNVDGFQSRLFGSRWRSAHKDHLTLFSTKTLGRLLAESGFRILRQFSYGGLAKGAGPDWIKKPLDKTAKAFNFGDVTAFMCEKRKA